MVTTTTKVTCPICESDNYDITNLSLVDIDLHATYLCLHCGTIYTNKYMLTYIGGQTDSIEYDRDNCISHR